MLEPDLLVFGVNVGPVKEWLGGILFVVLGVTDPDVGRPLRRVDRRGDASAPCVLDADPKGAFESWVLFKDANGALLGYFGPLTLIRSCFLGVLSRGAGTFEAIVDPDGVAPALLRDNLYVALDHRISCGPPSARSEPDATSSSPSLGNFLVSF